VSVCVAAAAALSLLLQRSVLWELELEIGMPCLKIELKTFYCE